MQGVVLRAYWSLIGVRGGLLLKLVVFVPVKCVCVDKQYYKAMLVSLTVQNGYGRTA